LDPLLENYDFFICSEDGYNLTNAAFGATPQHPALLALVDELLTSEPDWSLPPNETTGPVFYATVLKWRTDIAVLPRETFYPYNWNQPPCAPRPLTIGEHLWYNSWKTLTATHGAGPKFSATATALGGKVIRAAYRALGPLLKAHRIGLAALTPFGPEEAQWYSMSPDIVVRTRYGHFLIMSGYDLSITPQVLFKGLYEEEAAEERFLTRVLKGGDWFVDIGANVGCFSILGGAKVGPFGRVLAFEPNPRVADLLTRSIVTNWMHDRIFVHQCALGDTSGSVDLTFSEARLGDGRIQYSANEHSAFTRTLAQVGRAHSVVVEQRKLDDVIPVDLPIKLLKIDAEGHEGAILRGARRLVTARAFEFIVLEALPEVDPGRWHECLAEFQSLVKLGYRCGTLNGQGCIEAAESLSSALRRQRSRSLVFYSDAQ
jgi:FkbM family methyltransferase